MVEKRSVIDTYIDAFGRRVGDFRRALERYEAKRGPQELYNLNKEEEELEFIEKTGSRLFPSLNGISSSNFQLPAREPDGFSLGRLVIACDQRSYSPRVAFRVPLEKHIMIVSSLNPEAEKVFCHGFLFRFLTQFPPGRLKITLIDAQNQGQAFKPFLEMIKISPLVVGPKCLTTEREIEIVLEEVRKEVEETLQCRLGNNYVNLHEYNLASGAPPFPYHIIAVSALPDGFTKKALETLQRIAENGAKAGIIFFISLDSGAEPDRLIHLENIFCSCFHRLFIDKDGLVNLESGSFSYQHPKNATRSPDSESSSILDGCARESPGYGALLGEQLKIESLPPNSELCLILDSIAREYERASRKEISLKALLAGIGVGPGSLWSDSSAEAMEIPLGMDAQGQTMMFRLDCNLHVHAIVAGKPGSGKTNLLHVLLLGCMARYSPDEVELYLMDFKEGVEFQVYTQKYLPHIRIVGIESDREYGLSLLKKVQNIMTERGNLFKSAGASDFPDYRKRTRDPLPRILIMIDEFQKIIEGEDRLAQEAKKYFADLAKRGRSFGIHLILATQTLAGVHDFSRQVISTFALRLALSCTEMDSNLILGDGNPAAKQLTQSGDAIYNDNNGILNANRRFQVAFMDDVSKSFRDEAFANAEKRGRSEFPGRNVQVFRGTSFADPDSVIEKWLLDKGTEDDRDEIRIPVGEPLNLSDYEDVAFSMSSYANMLVSGNIRETREGLMTGMIKALAVSQRPATIFVFPFQKTSAALMRFLESASQKWNDRIFLQKPEDLEEIIGCIASELDERLKSPAEDHELRFLIIGDLEEYEQLKPPDPYARDPKPTTGGRFKKILELGGKAGIHVIGFVQGYPQFKNRIEGQKLAQFFTLRIATQLPPNAMEFIQPIGMEQLSEKTAFFYNSSEGVPPHRLKPFGLIPNVD